MRRHVEVLKYIIVSFTVVLLGILLVYTQPQKDLVPLLEKTYEEESIKDEKTDADVIAESLEDSTVEDLQQTVTNNPSFLGEDVNKKAWSLKSIRAIQHGTIADGFVDMVSVVAKTISAKDAKVDYVADEGKFITKNDQIILKGNVSVKSESFEIKGEHLEYNLKTTYAKSPVRVKVFADFGTLAGNTMESFNNADRIILKGNVRAKLYEKTK